MLHIGHGKSLFVHCLQAVPVRKQFHLLGLIYLRAHFLTQQNQWLKTRTRLGKVGSPSRRMCLHRVLHTFCTPNKSSTDSAVRSRLQKSLFWGKDVGIAVLAIALIAFALVGCSLGALLHNSSTTTMFFLSHVFPLREAMCLPTQRLFQNH